MMRRHAVREGKREFRLGRGACVAALVLALVVPGAVAQAATSPVTSPAPATPAQLPPPPASGEMAFVISTFAPAIVPGKAACPRGTENMVRDNFLTTVSPAERARLLKTENEVELTDRWKAYGFSPDRKMNVCTNYDKFDHPIYKGVQNNIAYGLNLDGDAQSTKPSDPYVCPHQKFTSPTGEKAVDNQLYRALGCERNWRAVDGGVGSDATLLFKTQLVTDFTIVMIVRNVRSLVNDDNVEVILASSPDTPITDTQQNYIHNASYQVSTNPRHRTVLHGRIVNGVLTTDTKDIVLARPIGLGGGKGLSSEWDFARSKMQLTFKPDGSLDGILDGYAPLPMFLAYRIFGGGGTVTVADIDCASQYRTLKAMADGERDPVTGQCNRISSTMHVEAVPAFVFDQSAATKTTEGK